MPCSSAVVGAFALFAWGACPGSARLRPWPSGHFVLFAHMAFLFLGSQVPSQVLRCLTCVVVFYVTTCMVPGFWRLFPSGCRPLAACLPLPGGPASCLVPRLGGCAPPGRGLSLGVRVGGFASPSRRPSPPGPGPWGLCGCLGRAMLSKLLLCSLFNGFFLSRAFVDLS